MPLIYKYIIYIFKLIKSMPFLSTANMKLYKHNDSKHTNLNKDKLFYLLCIN